MIWIHELDKSFGREKELFTNVNLLIPTGMTVGIIGNPGVGKSILLNMIAGAELPDRGRVFSDGLHLWSGGIFAAMHGQMTIYQSLRFLGRLYVADDREMEEKVETILKLSGLSDRRHIVWSKIPVRDRSLIRFAVMGTLEADYLLIDGPLAPQGNTVLLEKTLQNIRKSTTLMASPEVFIKKYCDAGIVIHEKKLHYFDAVEEAIQFHESVNNNESNRS